MPGIRQRSYLWRVASLPKRCSPAAPRRQSRCQHVGANVGTQLAITPNATGYEGRRVMLNVATRHGFLLGIGHFLEHAAAVVLGFVMMVVGLGLGVSMVMLPVGIVVGMLGFGIFVGGLFARIDRA